MKSPGIDPIVYIGRDATTSSWPVIEGIMSSSIDVALEAAGTKDVCTRITPDTFDSEASDEEYHKRIVEPAQFALDALYKNLEDFRISEDRTPTYYGFRTGIPYEVEDFLMWKDDVGDKYTHVNFQALMNNYRKLVTGEDTLPTEQDPSTEQGITRLVLESAIDDENDAQYELLKELYKEAIENLIERLNADKYAVYEPNFDITEETLEDASYISQYNGLRFYQQIAEEMILLLEDRYEIELTSFRERTRFIDEYNQANGTNLKITKTQFEQYKQDCFEFGKETAMHLLLDALMNGN